MDFVREPRAIQEFWEECELKGEATQGREKYFSECQGIYKDTQALEEMGDKVCYWVNNQNYNRTNFVKGNLAWGTTYLNPYTVGGECAMTGGHYHGDTDCDEYYYGLKGEGFLLLWDGADDFHAEKVFPGSLHYINGHYAHRLINSGDEVLAVTACLLPASNLDHQSIIETGFPYRCYKIDGEIKWVKHE